MTRYDRNRSSRRLYILGLLVAAGIVSIPMIAAVAQEKAVAPEKNPPGDIPDCQVFITYTSPLGFSLTIPEGWSSKDRADGASIFD